MKYLRKQCSQTCKDVHVAAKYWWMFKVYEDYPSWEYSTSAENTALEEAFRDFNTCQTKLKDA